MKSISNLHLFPRAARTLLLMVAITLTALTAGAEEYTITYHLNGGYVIGENITTYDGSNDYTLRNPYKPGYSFIGWTGTGLNSPSVKVTIPSGSTGNREYTANYSAAPTKGLWCDYADPDWGNDYENQTVFSITTAAQLAKFAAMVNIPKDDKSASQYSFDGKTVKLANDIDLSEHEWVAVGFYFFGLPGDNLYSTFSGTFDGGGHTISGMNVNLPQVPGQGLFGSADKKSTIKDVVLSNSYVNGNQRVGGIAGEANGLVENCHVLPNVTVRGDFVDVGTLVGHSTGTILGCSSGATLERGHPGIAGEIESLQDCFYYGYGPDLTFGIAQTLSPSDATVSRCFYATNATQGIDRLDDSQGVVARVYSVTAGEGVTLSRSGTAAATYYAGKLKFYDTSGCSFNGTEYVTEGTTLTVSTTATFQGYETAINVEGTGASLNEGTLTVGTANVTVSAVKGTPIDYTITYNLDGGTASNPLTYTIETEKFTLSNPIKAGYTFTGWSGTGLEGEANMTVTIAKGSTGDRSYTAHWTSAIGDTNGDWNGHAATSFATINTSAKTLSIASEAEMALLSKDASTYADYTVTLTADINLKDYFWTPIAGFNGTFDGQGHTISGVMINNSSSDDQGLFGVFGKSAKVRNLVIANSYISGGNNTGAVVGATDGTSEDASLIENCHVMESVTITGTEGANYGGIAGFSGGSIIACSSAAMMSAQGNNTAGIVGSGYMIDQCLYYGTILPANASTIGTLSYGYATNYQTYDATTTSHKYVRVYDADPGIMGTVKEEYSNTGYKVYEKGVSYGGKFYTAVVVMTEDGITNLTAYAGKTIDVAFNRSFDALGTSTGTVHAATICLPFSFAKPDDSVGKFYTFGGVTASGDDYTVTMTEVSGSEITAGTPYMFVPAGSGAKVFENAAFTVPSEGFTAAGKTENGGWAFTGTYTKLTWASGQTRLYGFAGKNFQTGGTDLNDIGAFRRFDYGTTAAFRCYLMAPGTAGARGNGAALPESMRVVFKGAGGSITGIGTIDTMTGEATLDGNGPWYTLGGQYLQGKPSRPGIYIHNGKKVVIK